MKLFNYLFLVLFLFYSNTSIAQGFKILPPSTALYGGEDSSIDMINSREIRGLEIENITNQDSLTRYAFKSNYIPSFLGWGFCQLATQSWLGEFLIYNDGRQVIQNYEDVQFYFPANMQVGDTWIMTDVDSLQLKATLEQQVAETFIGLTDEVMTIRLKIEKNGLVDETHVWHDRVIKISQNFGMIECPIFYDFPYHDTWRAGSSVKLLGLTEPQAGMQNLSRKEIYGFTAGDELHVKYQFEKREAFYGDAFGVPDSVAVLTHFYKFQILQIHDNGNFDVKRELVISTGVKIGYDYQNEKKYYNEYIVETFTNQKSLPFLEEELEERSFNVKIDPKDLDEFPLSAHCSRIVYQQGEPGERIKYTLIADDEFCGIMGLIDCHPRIQYLENLGGPYTFCENMSRWVEKRELVYYNSATQGENGTPFNTGIFAFTSVDDAPVINHHWQVYPNPIHKDQPSLILENEQVCSHCEVTLFDMQGRIVYQTNLNNAKVILPMQDILPGQYMVQVKSNEGVMTKKVIRF